MITNKNVVVLHTRKYEKLTLDNFEKQKESGVFILKCPETKQEIMMSWKSKKERNEIRKIYREIREEYKLKMVS
tara:strand:+ start:326 stop:547 length:222 start_codon:yes stop_codon:yes gene_type:complete